MKSKDIICALLGLGLVGAAVPGAQAKDKPDAAAAAKITEAIKAVYPDAVIGEMGKETEDGLSFYEVAVTVKGAKIDADVTSDGTIIETEESADIKTFPDPAAKALTKTTKGMKIKGAEIAKTYAKGVKDDTTGDAQVIHVTKLAEPTVAYEVDVVKDGKRGEFSVSAEGAILESPKWAGAGESDKEDKD
jgi:hypothetical protein